MLGSEKYEFFMMQINYLGQIIDENRRGPDPETAEAIRNMPQPNITNLPGFLVLASYYSIYIPKMLDVIAPLNDLLKKGAKWIWSKECEDAFKKIKSYLLLDL